MARKKKQDELIWADEVLEVYKNLGTLPGSRNWSSPSASNLFDWVVRDDNETKFLTTVVPKATDIRSKYGIEDVADAVKLIDVKTIKDLKKCLREALLDCDKGEDPHDGEGKDPHAEVEKRGLSTPTGVTLEDILG